MQLMLQYSGISDQFRFYHIVT